MSSLDTLSVSTVVVRDAVYPFGSVDRNSGGRPTLVSVLSLHSKVPETPWRDGCVYTYPPQYNKGTFELSVVFSVPRFFFDHVKVPTGVSVDEILRELLWVLSTPRVVRSQMFRERAHSTLS